MSDGIEIARAQVCVYRPAAMAPLVLLALLTSGDDARALAERALERNLVAERGARARLSLEVQRGGRVLRARELRTVVREKDGERRAFLELLAPESVAGTRFLSISASGEPTEQLVYLPAFRRVKRVVGQERKASFIGTDFSYADLEGREVDDAVWRVEKKAELGGQPCVVLVGEPRPEADLEYGLLRVWIHEEHELPMQVDFHDRAGEAVVKRFRVRRLEKRAGRWLAVESEMASPPRQSRTLLRLLQLELDPDIPDADVARRALER